MSSMADIIATTYEDTCTVYRPTRAKSPTGETVYFDGVDGLVVYSDIPCAVSSLTGGNANQTQTVAFIDADYKLFVRPEIDIKENDTVVAVRLGKTITGTAGLSDTQVSHNAVPIKLKKRDENE